MQKKRLQKVLAEAGIASRRKSETLIEAGHVLVNGKVARLGMSVSPSDEVVYRGKKVNLQRKEYFLLNKPVGYVVSKVKQGKTKTIYDLRSVPSHLFPVGRLDKETEGLLLLTNDGEFAQKMSHPKFEVKKTYEVLLDRPLEPHDRKKIEKGVQLTDEDGTRYTADRVHLDAPSERPQKLTVSLHMGKYHVIRKLFGSLGYAVKKLRRIQLGPFRLKNIPIGSVHRVTDKDIRSLF